MSGNQLQAISSARYSSSNSSKNSSKNMGEISDDHLNRLLTRTPKKTMNYSMIPTISAPGLGDNWEAEAAAKTAAIPADKPTDKPAGPRDWPIARIIEALSRPLPKTLTDTRKQGGATLTFIPWHNVNRILDKYAPGWTWQMTTTITPDRMVVTGRITIPSSEGNIYREAMGTETLKEEYTDKTDGTKKLRELAYGDPCSNAESMAFRRCAARFGLGLYLYQK
jgi:hypothetical protein